MKLPARMAVLNYLDKVGTADLQEVMADAKPTYGTEGQFTEDMYLEHLMSLEANGLVELTKYDLDKDENLRLHYHITDDGRASVTKYIPSQYRA
jgi:hypothetical protein